MGRYKFNPNRRAAKYCPCGKPNNDGKFAPFMGFIDKGHCFSCPRTIWPDDEPGDATYKKTQERIIAKMERMERSLISKETQVASFGKYDENVLVSFLKRLTNEETTNRLVKDYQLGTSMFWRGSTVFWQVDRKGLVRSGKIIQYHITNLPSSSIGVNCNRVKGNKPPVKWVHKLMQQRKLIESFNLDQCFFGEHLLTLYPDRAVAVVESEKSAVIGSAYHPEFVWLACGGADGLTETKVKALANRTVTFWPDLGKFDAWEKKACFVRKHIGVRVKTARLLERVATSEERARGFDIADFLIRQHWKAYVKDTEV